MSKISTYEITPVPKLADKLIGTSVGGEIEDITYNFTLSELLYLFIPNIPANTLQGVLDYGNEATQDIILNGTIFTTYLEVSNTATILNSYLTGETHITGGLYDRLNSKGTAGQVLRSTGTQVEWYSIPNVIPTLQQVLAAGNTADINVILSSNIQALTATANNVVSNTSLSVNGTLKDKDASVGTAGQILSSTGTKVQWINLPLYTAASPLSIDSITKVISIQQAGSTQNGYLSSADWINFDGKQGAISLTTVGSSGPATLVGNIINVPNYTLAGLGGVPQTRTLTINGITYDLSANRAWTIAAGVASVTATSPLFSTGGADPDISIQKASNSLDGYLSSADWLTFNSKQNFLGGTGLVKSTAGVITYIVDNSANWNTAYDNMIVSAAVTGISTKTLTLNQQDAGTITASWTDLGLTSVGVSMPSAFTVIGSPLTSNGVIGITGAGTTLQYIDGTGALQTFPSLTGYVPISRILTINGTAYDLSVNRSWSVGTVTSVAALTIGTTGTDLSSSVANGTTTPIITLNVPTASAANRGALSAADWSIFNTKVSGVTASSPLFSSGGSTPNITIQQSSGSQAGFLSAADWTTFNNKQAAGNYITSLTGEAMASGPGAASVTLSNSAVTAKVLTGINITGGTVVDTDSILTGFGKLQNQINSLIGSTIYKGTWNASTNTPALASGVGTRGWYYIVNVAGTTNLDGIIDWFVGDWAIFDGSAWQQVDNTDAVVSVNGQTGAVSLTTDNIPEGSTNQYYLNSRARAALSFTAGSGAYNSTTGVITIPTNTSQLTNGANFITLASLSGTAPIMYNNTTGAISITQAGTASNGYLSSTDWNTFNNKQATITLTTTGTSGVATLVGTVLNIPNYAGVVTSVFGRTGAILAVSGDYNTDLVTEGSTNLYFTNARTRLALSAGTGISYNNTTGVITSTITQYTDALARASISLTTTGTSGAATYNSTTGVFNIPNYAGGVTSVFGRTGAVVAASGDYTTTQVTEGTNLYYTEARVNANTNVAANTAARHNAVTIGTANGLSLSTQALSLALASTSATGALSSTDWNTFNSKQNTLTNPVTGTGASGYVSFWDSANSISGESNLFWDATNNRLGINITPSYALHTFSSGNTTSASAVIRGQYYGALISTDSILSTYYAFNIENGSATSLFMVKANGNIGINTTTDAGYKLDVNGTGRFTQSRVYNSTSSALSEVISTSGRDAITYYFDGTYSAGVGLNYGTNPNKFVFYFNGGTALSFDTSRAATFFNNVNIGGVYTASYLLDINSISNFDIRLRKQALGGTVGILFETANDFSGTSQAWIRGTGAGSNGTSFLSFGTATNNGDTTGTEKVRINNIGFVGIGQVNPTVLLDLKKAHSAAYGQLIDLINLNAYFPGYDVDSQRAGIAAGVPPVSFGNTGYGWMSFRTRGSAGYLDRMIINPDGTIFVNSTTGVSGGGALQVNGNVNINGVFQINGTTIGGGGGSSVTGSGTSGYVTRWTGGTTLGNSSMYDTGTNVGIGTTSVRYLLDLAGVNNAAQTDSIGMGVNNGISDNSGTGYGGGIIWKANYTGYTKRSAGILQTAEGDYFRSGLAFFYNGSADQTTDWVEGLRLRDNGNFGVNIKNPLFKLHVQIGTASSYTSQNPGDGIHLSSGSTTPWISADYGGNTAYFGPTNSTTNVKFAGYNYATGAASDMEIGQSAMYVKSNNNILIGTSTDNGYKLQINGSISFAYGFTNVFRGSSGANDILVGNTGSTFYVGGSVTATGGFFDSSDSRLKILVKNYKQPKGIENVAARIYVKNGKKELGYFAQDLQEILPSAVAEGADGFLVLSYSQVHTAKISVIEDKVTILEREVSELKTKLQKYEA